LAWKGKVVTLSQMNQGRAAERLGAVRGQAEVTLLDCTPLWIVIGNSGSPGRSIPIGRVDGERQTRELVEALSASLPRPACYQPSGW
jgi:hypothetical protein